MRLVVPVLAMMLRAVSQDGGALAVALALLELALVLTAGGIDRRALAMCPVVLVLASMNRTV